MLLRFCPAEEGFGVAFQRSDLPGRPLIPAHVRYVQETLRSTTIGLDGVQIQTVEHLLAAVKAFGLDNLLIEISDSEPPVGDGSSSIFVEALERGGSVEQERLKPIFSLKQPLFLSEGEVHLVALPYQGFRISYMLHDPGSGYLPTQYYSTEVTKPLFCEQIAACRTFAKYEELSRLIECGLIRGGSLSNAVVVKGEAALSRGGLHFPDEMARHKILDLIGDLALIGADLEMSLLAVRSGHASNVALAKMIHNKMRAEEKLWAKS